MLTEDGMVEVPDENLDDFIRAAYDLSVPLGLGFFHFKDGSLPDEELEFIKNNVREVRRNKEYDPKQLIPYIDMDYVKGRSIKMHIYINPTTLKKYIRGDGKWYDHTEDQYLELLRRAGLTAVNLELQNEG